MKRWQAILATLGLWAGPVANIWFPFIPPVATPYVVAGLATVNLFVVKKASESNPNGTPAQIPWVPGEPKTRPTGYEPS